MRDLNERHMSVEWQLKIDKKCFFPLVSLPSIVITNDKVRKHSLAGCLLPVVLLAWKNEKFMIKTYHNRRENKLVHSQYKSLFSQFDSSCLENEFHFGLGFGGGRVGRGGREDVYRSLFDTRFLIRLKAQSENKKYLN